MSGKMEPKRLAGTRDSIDHGYRVSLAEQQHLLAAHDYWRARADVNSRDVEAAGITLAQCEAWLVADGWTLGSHPDNDHRCWEKTGHDNVNLSPNTPTWTYCLATGIAVTIQIRAEQLGRPCHDILEEMAAIEVSP
jgi:hypothetical protein